MTLDREGSAATRLSIYTAIFDAASHSFCIEWEGDPGRGWCTCIPLRAANLWVMGVTFWVSSLGNW